MHLDGKMSARRFTLGVKGHKTYIDRTSQHEPQIKSLAKIPNIYLSINQNQNPESLQFCMFSGQMSSTSACTAFSFSSTGRPIQHMKSFLKQHKTSKVCLKLQSVERKSQNSCKNASKS